MRRLLTAERLRAHWPRLALATFAPFAALVGILAAVVTLVHPHVSTLQSVASPEHLHTAVVERRGGVDYPVSVRTGRSTRPLGCVDGRTLGEPLVQWLDDQTLRITIGDGDTTDVVVVSLAGGTATEQTPTPSLHTC